MKVQRKYQGFFSFMFVNKFYHRSYSIFAFYPFAYEEPFLYVVEG